MAMAARRERGLFDPDAAPGESPFDHQIYVIASDGDIEEGITSEASSLAGTQQLGNLTVVYDDNKISIEDDTDDRAERGHREALRGLRLARPGRRGRRERHRHPRGRWRTRRAETDRPSFILLRTVIAFPAPKAMNTGKAHGSALGDARSRAVKEVLGFDPDQTFEVDDEVLAHARKVVERGRRRTRSGRRCTSRGPPASRSARSCWTGCSAATCPIGWEKALPSWEPDKKGVATRKASGEVLKALADVLPELWGGSADLAESNNTTMEGANSFGPTSIATKMWDARALRPHPALRGPRARDGRDPQRHRPARPHPPLRRHVPHVQRLHARCRAARRGDEGAGRLRVDARLHRPRRGRPHPPADRAPGRAAGDPEPRRSCAPATRTRPRTPGRRCWRTPRAPRGSR